MNTGRWVNVQKSTVYQGDSGVDEFIFTLDKTYGDIDLSHLNGYLKVTYPDDSGDVLLLTKQIDGDKIILKWVVEGKSTRVSGQVLCQILLEKSDNTIIFNSQVFKIEIKKSVNSTLLSLGGKTSVEILLETLNEKIEQTERLLQSDIVNSVNNRTGNVILDASSVGAITGSDLDAEIEKVKSGEYVSKKAECDDSGNNISQTYLKNEKLSDFEWKEVAVLSFPTSNSLEVNLGDKYKELYILLNLSQKSDLSPVFADVRLEEKRNGYNTLLFSTSSCDISLYSTTNYVSLRVTMCSNYAKVDCAKTTLSSGTTYEVESTTNIGKNTTYPYLENLRIVFCDDNGSEVYCQLGTAKIYGLKYLL